MSGVVSRFCTHPFLDRVPLSEVTIWRSYTHVIATLGRSSGAPLGGLLADTVGWRWEVDAPTWLVTC